VMIWAAMAANHLFGPYFFEGPVNQGTDLTMLRDPFVPQDCLDMYGFSKTVPRLIMRSP
jgi:hypothetical protein